jgi:hypothetical protein
MPPLVVLSIIAFLHLEILMPLRVLLNDIVPGLKELFEGILVSAEVALLSPDRLERV